MLVLRILLLFVMSVRMATIELGVLLTIQHSVRQIEGTMDRGQVLEQLLQPQEQVQQVF